MPVTKRQWSAARLITAARWAEAGGYTPTNADAGGIYVGLEATLRRDRGARGLRGSVHHQSVHDSLMNVLWIHIPPYTAWVSQ